MSYSSTILADSPDGYWRLGEASGTTAADSSGNGRNGTYGGTVTYGAAGALNGDADTAITVANASPGYVDVTNATVRDLPTGSFTVEFWAKASANTTSQAAVAWHGTDDLILYPFDTTGGNGFRVFWRDMGGAGIPLNENDADRADGNWHQFAMTWDGTTASIYADGAFITSTNPSGTRGPFTGFRIGGWAENASQAFGGGLDEVSVYGASLSAARILAHYDAGISAPSTLGTRTWVNGEMIRGQGTRTWVNGRRVR